VESVKTKLRPISCYSTSVAHNTQHFVLVTHSESKCFFLFFLEGGVGLVPKRGYLLTLAYYAFPRWYVFGERRWNDILTGENRRTRRKTCPSATLSTINPTWIDPCSNPGIRGERPATNDLSHGTAFNLMVTETLWPSFLPYFIHSHWTFCSDIQGARTVFPTSKFP
jgi:hypothetical protein